LLDGVPVRRRVHDEPGRLRRVEPGRGEDDDPHPVRDPPLADRLVEHGLRRNSGRSALVLWYPERERSGKNESSESLTV